eukprot:jgi/Botrbrau1/17863/Bobra.0127s0102.1
MREPWGSPQQLPFCVIVSYGLVKPTVIDLGLSVRHFVGGRTVLLYCIMTEPDSSKKSLANTVTQCDLVKRALHLHDIISKFPGKTDREIMKDLSMNQWYQILCRRQHLICRSLFPKLPRCIRPLRKQFINPLQITGQWELGGKSITGS